MLMYRERREDGHPLTLTIATVAYKISYFSVLSSSVSSYWRHGFYICKRRNKGFLAESNLSFKEIIQKKI